jgi:drug/metabolite transporter (DMT)-like permease
VALVVPGFQLADSTTRGAMWGTASGASFAVLSILNRRHVRQYPSLVIAFYQDSAAALALLPFLFVLKPVLTIQPVLLLILLGVVFTAVSHTLFISGLRTVPARSASVIASLEPVYGIAAAAVFLQEIPSMRVLLGGAVILAAAGYATLKK